MLNQYWTMGRISKVQEAGLLKAVKIGTGLAGCHGGLGDSFRENTEVLATTTFDSANDSWIEGAVMPVSRKKYFAKGRGFYLPIGHDPIDFDTPAAWKLLMRGIRWASGSKYFPKENTMRPVYQSKTLKR